jgi:uncharacterized membrane protein
MGMTATPRRFRLIHAAALGSLTAVLLGCDERPTAPQFVESEEEIPLSEVQPREAGQGETVHIQVLGSGFQPGDEVVFELDGGEVAGIVVQETLFATERRLIATLSIGTDVTAGSYDVVVRGRHRRRGIGTEFFDILKGRGSELEAQFSFNYQGHRTGDFEVDNTFILEPDEMFGPTGHYALTYFNRTMQEQVISAQQPRDDGRIDWIACWAPGGKVREPGSRLLECWMEIGLDLETYDWEDGYTSWVGGDRPADGSGRITFTSVTTQRMTGEFSIEMHQEYDWDGELETLLLTDGTFDLPVISAHWQEAGSGDEVEEGDLAHAAYDAVLLAPAGRASRISDSGFIVGSATEGRVLWSVAEDGRLTGPTQLGVLPAPFDVGFHSASDVNDVGMVVGTVSGHAPSDRPSTGFIYDGRMSRLRSTLEGTEYHTSARAINDAGQVAGWIGLIGHPSTDLFSRAAVWLEPLSTDEEPILLEPLPGHDRTSASRINDRGHVLGLSWDSEGVIPGEWGRRTVRWQIRGDGTASDPAPITRDAERHFQAVDMTADGDVVGSFFGDLDEGGLVRFGSDTVIRLSTIAGSDPFNRIQGVSVSPEGLVRIIGRTRAARSGMAREIPVLWEIDADDTVVGPLRIDPPPSRVDFYLEGINAHGWMVGFAFEPGVEAPTLWRPASPAAAAAPSAGLIDPCSTHRDVRFVPRCR